MNIFAKISGFTSTVKIFLIMTIYILTIENFALAAEIPPAPTENIYVADFAGMINDSDKQQILAVGDELDKKHRVQISVVTIQTLGNLNIDRYADELFKNWNIGGKELNNGVLLLIAKDDRRFKIKAGDGLKDAITDEYAGEVLANMTNYFRESNFSEGILTTYGTLTKKIYEVYGGAIPENIVTQKPPEKESSSDTILGVLAVIIFLALAYFLLKYIFILPIAVSIYIVAALAYWATHGKYGTLNFKSIYDSLAEFVRTHSFGAGSSKSKKSSGKKGRGNGR